MRVFGKNHLVAFAEDHPDIRSALAVWEREMEHAEWASPSDLVRTYPNARHEGKDSVIFKIHGDGYRLCARVNYATGIAIVIKVVSHGASR